jgi:hypothetical protein
LRLATNFQGKVIGIAIKDRGGILPAGHSANAAYWYDSQEGYWDHFHLLYERAAEMGKRSECKKV